MLKAYHPECLVPLFGINFEISTRNETIICCYLSGGEQEHVKKLKIFHCQERFLNFNQHKERFYRD